jgi:ligand-binding sensor domain-containing protein
MQFNLIKRIFLTLLFITGIFSNCAIANISLGNVNWEIFTNRSSVLAIDASKDGEMLWIGTAGGLEQRTTDGQLVRVFTTLDGLPDNFIWALENDADGGLWVGTKEGGLAYRDNDGNWQIFNTDNSDLPDNNVFTLVDDNEGGLWIGTKNGLAHLGASSKWQVFNTDNSGLPHNYVKTVATDGNGGLWVGGVGIAHLDNKGKWEIFNSDNSDLPHDGINTLISDGEGGIWVGTYERTEDGKTENSGLTHLNSRGKGQTFNTNNSGLPHDRVSAISSDSKNGLWLGTQDGFAHKKNSGEWEVFNKNNSDLPHNTVYTLFVDEAGGQWLGTDNGLALFNNKKWQTFNESSELPDNIVQAIANDANGGLWVGTHYAGMAHIDALGEWKIFNTDNSDLPKNDVNALLIDGNDGVWVGTYGGGLAQLRSSGKWKIFNALNSELPNNKINAMVNDGTGGIWVATDDGGLAHLNASAQWKIFNTENSDLPDNDVNTLIKDSKGGLWLGTNAGLAHFDSKSKWKIFDTDNSDLPVNTVLALTLDQDGIWVGTHKGGLAHFDGDSKWQEYKVSNSDLPDDTIIGLVNDNLDGLWVGTLRGGIAHFSDAKKWAAFNTNNSGLPTNVLLTLISDNNNGLWIGMHWGGGLAHLTLGQPLKGKRAAILIHPNVHGGIKKHILNKGIAGHVYHALSQRYYTNEEIYLLSYDVVDINRDSITDKNVVDAPQNDSSMTLDDVKQAFDWAKQQGTLNEPLLVVVISDDLSDDKLLLNPDTGESLNVTELKAFLDSYQTETENEVVIVLEASHAGQFVPALKKDASRIIIASASADKSTQNRDVLGRTTFSGRYFDELRRGNNFWEAFNRAADTLSQAPQFDDDNREGRLAKRMCLNGCFNPHPSQNSYKEGEAIRITLNPDILRDNRKDSYAAIGFPNGGPMFMFTQLNEAIPFDGVTLLTWQGEDMVLDNLPVTSDLQRGEYALYLLRVDKGIDNPFAHPDLWELNRGSMTIE